MNTGPATAWPPGILKLFDSPEAVADETEEGARVEAKAVLFAVVQVKGP